MKRITTIGGGTGSYTLLSGLRDYATELTAVVSVADNGGSSGKLRDELGILPPGDALKCMIALSEEKEVLRQLFNYRFSDAIGEHSLGNLIITGFYGIRGNFPDALYETSKLLKVKGKVLPISTDDAHLNAELESGEIINGETNIDIRNHDPNNKIKRVWLEPNAFAYGRSLEAISQSDLIIIGPGDLYTSIIPNLLVEGVPEALRQTKAKKVYVVNIMTKPGETDDYTAGDFVKKLTDYLGSPPDYALINVNEPPQEVAEAYRKEGSVFVSPSMEGICGVTPLFLDLIDETPGKRKKNKKMSLMRHSQKKLGRAIINL